MNLVTVEFILSKSPCSFYDETRLRELGGDGLTREQILDLKIPEKDRIWVLTRSGVMTKAQQVEFACRCAERALPIYENRCPGKLPREAIEAARAWLSNPSDETRDAADAAAYAAYAADAADAAAYYTYAAYAATYAADAAASYDTYAATYAADAAATYAADAAAYAADAAAAAAYYTYAAYAARLQEYKLQIQDLREIISYAEI